MYGAARAACAARDGSCHRIDRSEGTLAKAFAARRYIAAAPKSSTPCLLCAGLHLHDRAAARRSVRPRPPRSVTLKSSNWERERHQDRAARVKAILSAAGLPVMSSDTHIVPLFVGDPELCKQASDIRSRSTASTSKPINYPTVARGTERLRITPSPYHEDGLIDGLARGPAAGLATAPPAPAQAIAGGRIAALAAMDIL